MSRRKNNNTKLETICSSYSEKCNIFNKFRLLANQSSKSTSSKKMRGARDTSPIRPYSEFPATASAFSGLVLSIFAPIFLGFLSLLSISDTYATTSSISLSLSSGSISLDVLQSSKANGDFGKSPNTTISVSTNNSSGYTLGIQASNATNYNKLMKVNDNTTYIESITSAVSEADFSNDNISTYVNKWGYLPSKYCTGTTSSSCSTNASFRPAPNANTGDTLGITECANNTTNCPNATDTYDMALGTRVNSNQTPGAYSNTYVITAVANAIPYTITYNANGGTGAPANVNSSTFAETVALSTATPTKTNYSFNGWCTVSPTTTGGVDACTGGTTYAAGANWTLDQTSATNALTLFAMWSLKSYNITVNFAGSGVTGVILSNSTYGGGGTVTTSGGTVSLKHGVAYDISGTYNSGYEFDSWATAANGTLGSTSAASTTYTVSGTSTLTLTGKRPYMQNMAASDCTTTVKTVYDNRDETAYHVQRLADGKCWMLDNLALDLVAKKNVLTQNNTHASNTTLNYLKNGGGSTSDKYATAAVSNWTTGSYSYSAPLVNISDKDIVPANPPSGGLGNNKVGGYYNYCAAAAGSYCYSGNASFGNATEDICPKGWRLPTGDFSSGEYDTLYSKYNDYVNFRTALSLPLSGYMQMGHLSYRGEMGSWWSSTDAGGYGAMSILCAYINVARMDVYLRTDGHSVRCILGS
ncbi:InlB B-repeat-containing protein [Candidatus Saccharibacteria bacterium]|nr:InlB B-repeat-containing protein [Candidatus Saccharibacteria bacterium]